MNEIKIIYEKLERKILILIAISLAFFGFSYLYTQNGTISIDGLPSLAPFWGSFFLSGVILLLAIQYFNFRKNLKIIIRGDFELITKLKLYAQATSLRYWGYFFGGLICAVGLFFFQNPGFTMIYAITLVMVSFTKPTPDRIIDLLKLKGEEKEKILELKRRG